MTSKLTTIGIAATLVLSGTMTSASECVVPAGEGRVTLDCRGVPLGQVLRGLHAVAPIDTKLIDSAAQEVPIYVGLTDASMAQAVQATLEAAGISFVMSGSEAAELKIYISAQPGSPASPIWSATLAKPSPGADGSESVDDDEAAGAAFPTSDSNEEVSIVTTPPPGAPAQPESPATAQTMENILGVNPDTTGEVPTATMEQILGLNANTTGKPPAATMQEIVGLKPDTTGEAPAGTMEAIVGPKPATTREAPAATMEEILARKPPEQEKPNQ